jgi:type II secretory pathway component GspD/PulD (secretin)
MMPQGKCITAMPQDKLRSVIESLVKEKIGCVVVVDPDTGRAVGIVTKQDTNRMFLNQVSGLVEDSYFTAVGDFARGGSLRVASRGGEPLPPLPLHFMPRKKATTATSATPS